MEQVNTEDKLIKQVIGLKCPVCGSNNIVTVLKYWHCIICMNCGFIYHNEAYQ